MKKDKCHMYIKMEKKPLEVWGDTRKEGTWERWGRGATAEHILLEK